MVGTVTTILQVGLVFAILAAAMWALKRYGNKNTRSGAVQVLTRTTLAGHASVAVVKVGETAYLLGVTDQQVTLLNEVDPATVTAPEPTAAPTRSFAAMLGRAEEREPTTLAHALVNVWCRYRAARDAQRTPSTPAAKPSPAQKAAKPAAPAKTRPATKTGHGSPRSTSKQPAKSRSGKNRRQPVHAGGA